MRVFVKDFGYPGIAGVGKHERWCCIVRPVDALLLV